MTRLAYYHHRPPQDRCPVRELRPVTTAAQLGRAAAVRGVFAAELAGWGCYPCPACGEPLWRETEPA